MRTLIAGLASLKIIPDGLNATELDKYLREHDAGRSPQ
jgi:hypothetical protein